MNQPPVPPAQPLPPKTCPFAVVSLVVGIVSFCKPVVGSIAAIVLGFVALGKIRSSSGTLTGQGMAIAGIVLGCVSFGLALLWILIVVAFGVPWGELLRVR